VCLHRLFEEQADGMEGVQNAIDTFNAQTGSNLRSAEDLFKDIPVEADAIEALMNR